MTCLETAGKYYSCVLALYSHVNRQKTDKGYDSDEGSVNNGQPNLAEMGVLMHVKIAMKNYLCVSALHSHGKIK